MKYLRGAAYVIFAWYLGMAILNPERIYVDRFLINDVAYAEWAMLQMLPSMYTTEIEITRESDGRVYSVPHHPVRVVFENRNPTVCEEYAISVRYQDIQKSRRYVLCNGKLTFL